MAQFSLRELEEKIDVVHFDYKKYWDGSLVVFKEKAAEIIIPCLFVSFLSIVLTQTPNYMMSFMSFYGNLGEVTRLFSSSFMGGVMGLFLFPLTVGLFSYLRKKIKNEDADFGSLFSFYSADKIVDIFIINLIFMVVMYVGFLLCIIPGLLVATMYIFIPLVYLDLKEKEPKLILKACYLILQKNIAGMIVLNLAIVLIVLLGLLACCVGILVAGPFAYLFGIHAWEDLKEQLKLGKEETPRGGISLEKNEE